MKKLQQKSEELKLVQARVEKSLALKVKAEAKKSKRSLAQQIAFYLEIGVNNPSFMEELSIKRPFVNGC